MIERIQWLGHASFRIQGLPFIYIDPWRISRNAFHADVVLVSHDHYDHCSLPDVEKLRGPDTIVLANSMAAALLPDTTILRPWQVININSASIRAIPAYNSHHPKDFGGLGFVISMEHTDIYFAGDTGLIDEMSTIRADIAILPIGGRQTMNVDQAIEAVRRIHPRWVIPSHWGTSTEGGTEMDARLFAERVKRDNLAEVVIPTRS
ncbi:MAG TPA: MBL fold metallo-hydrolase [Aggregatilineales bacterium]|nr:MBL fold metallo-hydrolase [Aggregatilineales bacterium]